MGSKRIGVLQRRAENAFYSDEQLRAKVGAIMSRFFVATVAARPAPISFDIEVSDEAAMEKFNADSDFAIAVIAENYLVSGGLRPYAKQCAVQEATESPRRTQSQAMTSSLFPGIFIWVRE
jgi:hypothetical protein